MSCHYNLRKYSFSMRITNVWNSLPFSVVTAASVNPFKDWIITGHHKNLDTMGRQDYQEPGVEAELNFENLRVLPLNLLNNDMAQKHFAFAHNIRYVMLC